jgi:excisionase family DNA binding protein
MSSTKVELLTVQEVARELRVSTGQVYVLLRRRELLVTRIGAPGRARILRSELERYIRRATGPYKVRPQRGGRRKGVPAKPKLLPVPDSARSAI